MVKKWVKYSHLLIIIFSLFNCNYSSTVHWNKLGRRPPSTQYLSHESSCQLQTRCLENEWKRLDTDIWFYSNVQLFEFQFWCLILVSWLPTLICLFTREFRLYFLCFLDQGNKYPFVVGYRQKSVWCNHLQIIQTGKCSVTNLCKVC